MLSKYLNIFINFVIFITFSSLVFSQNINLPYLKLISPNGGENWAANSTQTIKWNSDGVSKIKIEYSLSGGLDWSIIQPSIDASLSEYSWKVANAQTPYVLFRISDASNPAVFDIGDKEFSVYIQPVIKKLSGLKKTESVISNNAVNIMPLGNSITWGVNPDECRKMRDIGNFFTN